MSADRRREVWKELENVSALEGLRRPAYMEERGFWMQKRHIFMYPFYYIDYAMRVGAFALYGRMKEDPDRAWQDYLTLCRAGGGRPYGEAAGAGKTAQPVHGGMVAGGGTCHPRDRERQARL